MWKQRNLYGLSYWSRDKIQTYLGSPHRNYSKFHLIDEDIKCKSKYKSKGHDLIDSYDKTSFYIKKSPRSKKKNVQLNC